MRVEINQSNKIEQTNKDTIIGLANTISFTILINRKIKRKLQKEFRKRGKPKLFVYRTFIAGVILLLKYAQIKNLSRVIIDEEYYGKDRMLKSMFLEMGSRLFKEVPEVTFEKIGKKSKVHSICYLVMKGKDRVGKAIGLEEIKRLALR